MEAEAEELLKAGLLQAINSYTARLSDLGLPQLSHQQLCNNLQKQIRELMGGEGSQQACSDDSGESTPYGHEPLDEAHNTGMAFP